MNGKDLFEHYIMLTVADSSILNCDKSDFSTYSGYATYIHNQLSVKKVDTVNRYIYAIVKDLKDIYGITESEALQYTVKFFVDRKWEKYHQPVRMVRNHFGKFLSA